jgi:hypothetical protein
MRDIRRTGLNVAFIYDPKDYYQSLGFSDSECADLADDVTIRGIASALEDLGHRVVHVPGIDYLVKHLAAEHHKHWDLVFNYSEGVFGSARESQVPALLEAYQIPFTFSDAATLALGIDKGKTKVSLYPHPFVIFDSDCIISTLADGVRPLSNPNESIRHCPPTRRSD